MSQFERSADEVLNTREPSSTITGAVPRIGNFVTAVASVHQPGESQLFVIGQALNLLRL